MRHILEDTWAYQEIKQEGRQEGRQEGFRQAILKIMHARFPRIETQASQRLQRITDLVLLQQVVVKVSIAQDDDEALQAVVDANGAKN